MKDLLDMRAERIGIKLLRTKTLDPWVHATARDNPLLDMLYTITRPIAAKRKKRLREILAETPPPQPVEPVALPKGMVQYRRELWGPHDNPN